MYIYTYIFIYIYMCVCIYIYIYIYVYHKRKYPYLSPSHAELHIGQCIFSNHPCHLPRQDYLPTSVQSSQVFAEGLRPVLPPSSTFPFSFWSPVHHLFGSSVLVPSDHMTEPHQSLSSDDAAQFQKVSIV